jgi:hypothetical protein
MRGFPKRLGIVRRGVEAAAFLANKKLIQSRPVTAVLSNDKYEILGLLGHGGLGSVH